MPTHTGVRLIFDPEAKPINRQYTIVNPTITSLLIDGEPPSDKTAAGSQNAKDVIMHMLRVMIIRLKRPNLSARYPGAQRPRDEPALKMATS